MLQEKKKLCIKGYRIVWALTKGGQSRAFYCAAYDESHALQLLNKECRSPVIIELKEMPR